MKRIKNHSEAIHILGRKTNIMCFISSQALVSFSYPILTISDHRMLKLEIISGRFGYRPKYQLQTPLSARENITYSNSLF